MTRIAMGFIAGYTFAKVVECYEWEKMIKNIIRKCKDIIKEEFKKNKDATETS